ncbi:PrsW family intramembrane metalloprotease, partial [Kineococcus glutinatus]|uniref:PrsW family intramembrane metalloprotease n=1 Tax=Kineococcus glutinatus TaxID=1070872 RepID=UPI0031E87978
MSDDAPLGALPRGTRPGAAERRRLPLTVLTVVILVGCGLLSFTAVTLEIGADGLLWGLLLAAVPVGPVLASVMWLDRHEAEPPHLLAFAFGWGACVATLGALVINTVGGMLLERGGVFTGGIADTSVVLAPVVEEALKGAAVLLVVLVQRRQFDGVVDGIVYAAFAGVGFAFLENVLYLGRALATDDAASLAVVFVLRCIASPFAHPLFTMATGVGLGIAARSSSLPVRLGAPVLGFCVAVCLHALWNASASTGLFLPAYVLLQVPIFAAAVTIALVARVREARLIARHLRVYAATGWLTDGEVRMLTSSAARRQARAWALRAGGRPARTAMAEFQDTAS